MMTVNGIFFSSWTKAGRSRGLAISTLCRAPLDEGEQLHRQREDVIERQRRHDDVAACLELGLHPRRGLLEVRDHVAVRQHRRPWARRSCRPCTAGTRCRPVVSGTGSSGSLRPTASAALNGTAPSICHGGTIFFPYLTTRFVSSALIGGKRSPSLGGDHRLDRRPLDDLLDGVREILEHDDRLRAGVVELVLELAARVERVAVDDHQAGAERGEQRDRILQHVRHHDRDAVALRRDRNAAADTPRARGSCGRPRHR